MKILKTSVLIAALALPVQAATPKNYFYAGAGNVGMDPDWAKSSSIYENPSFEIGGGHYYSDHLIVGGFFRYSSNEDSAKTQELDVYHLGVSATGITDQLGDTPLRLFVRGSAMSVYHKSYDTTTSSRTNTASDSGAVFDIGLGIQWDLASDYWIRAEYLYGYAVTGFDSEPDYDGTLITLGKGF